MVLAHNWNIHWKKLEMKAPAVAIGHFLNHTIHLRKVAVTKIMEEQVAVISHFLKKIFGKI